MPNAEQIRSLRQGLDKVMLGASETDPSALNNNSHKDSILRLRAAARMLSRPPAKDNHFMPLHILQANGAELQLDPNGQHGRSIAYIDADSQPIITRLEGVSVQFSRHTSIGLNGRRERQVIFEGNNGLVAKSLIQFKLAEETITIKNDEPAPVHRINPQQTHEVAA